MMKTMQHKGRTGLVTGATGGLGEAQSEALARAGADVLMLDIKGSEKADALASRLPEGAGRVRFVSCDLSRP